MFLKSWALSVWRWWLIVVNVHRNVIKGLHHMWRLKWSISIIKLLLPHTAHWNTKLFRIFGSLVSLSSLISDFNAPGYLWLDIFVVICSFLSDLCLVISLESDYLYRLCNDGWLLKVLNVFLGNSWGVLQFLDCLNVFHLCMLFKLCSLSRIYNEKCDIKWVWVIPR